jgi:hypothetical protein
MERPTPSELQTALEAMRRAGAAFTDIAEAWITPGTKRRQLFVVTRRTPTLERGDPYDTWIVNLASDGSVIGVDRFESIACRTS